MTRPFRLEIEAYRYATSTFSSKDAAEASVGAVLGRWGVKPGTHWKITERRREPNAKGRMCTRFHTVAEGVA